MKRSLVLITTDCLRADHVGFMGYARGTTPVLDRLASESTIVPTAIVAGTPTYFSLPALLASRPPLALGRDIIGIAPGEPTLASVLRDEAYATAAFCAGNPYLSPRFGYHQGYDLFRDFLDADQPAGCVFQPSPLRTRLNSGLQNLSSSNRILRAAYNELYFQYCQRFAGERPRSLDHLRRFPSADVIVDHARAWLSSLGSQPFFLWLHFMDPHSPYYPQGGAFRGEKVSPFRARYLNSLWNRGDLGPARLRRYRDHVVRLYDAGIRWVDAQVGRLLDILKRFRQWDDCLFAFTADHGEEFLDHGGRYHQPLKLTEELIRVPLLLRAPGLPAVRACDRPFSLLNLAPTLLDCAGVNSPPEFRGRSHRDLIINQQSWSAPAIVEAVEGCSNPFRLESRFQGRILAVRDHRYKLVLRFHPQREEWFDLAADPLEHNPLAAPPDPSAGENLLYAALQHLRQTSARRSPAVRLGAAISDIRDSMLARPAAVPT